MDTIRRTSPFSLPFLTGTVFFLISLAFFYFSVLDIDLRNSSLLDLDPRPDAVEYFAQAKALSRGKLPLIQIGHERLPSAFPPGYPALMVPWLKILPHRDSILAPFRTSQTIGLLILLSTFGFYYYLGAPLAGGVASLLLSTLPGFFTFCRSPMSDASAWLFYILTSMFAYLGLKEQSRWKIYLSAALLGLSMNLRLQSAFFLPLLLAMPLLPMKPTRWRWFWHCVAAGLIFTLAASPFLVLNVIEFHSPFKMGGDFWYPPRQLFSLQSIPAANVALFWKELTLQPIGFYAANLFGTGTVFVPAFALLILSGFFFLRMNRAVLCLFLTDGFFLVMTAAYLYPDGRYYLQLLILLLPLAVLPVVWAMRNALKPKWSVAAVGILALFIAACLGYPSRSGYRTAPANRFQAWDALHYFTWQPNSTWLAAERDFVARNRPQRGVVFSDIDPVYLNALLPGSFVAAPIDERQIREWSPTWRYGWTQATALAKQGLDQSESVYALIPSRKDIEEILPRLPKVAGYKWAEIPSHASDAILKLTPATL